jgi:ATP-dependent Clp protease protease subunit
MYQRSKRKRLAKHKRYLADSDSDSDSDSSSQSRSSRRFSVKLCNRNILFFGEVSLSSAAKLTQILRKLESMKARDPVTFDLCSVGGNMDAGLQIYDLMRVMPFPIHLVMHGECFSAATLIALGAEHRRIMPNAFVMMHQLRSACSGTLQEIRVETRNCNRYHAIMTQIYTEHLTLNKDEIETELGDDTVMSSGRAVEIGLAHEVLVPPQRRSRGRRKTNGL